jgi:hypothetical protein
VALEIPHTPYRSLEKAESEVFQQAGKEPSLYQIFHSRLTFLVSRGVHCIQRYEQAATHKKGFWNMGKHSHTFSETEIHILQTGIKWIQEAPEAFTHKLYHRLLQEHPEISALLHSLSLQSFSRRLVRFLELVIGELRLYGSLHFSPRDYWVKQLKQFLPAECPLNLEQFTRITETFLDVFSELAEDAWSPALESVWKKAIDEVSRYVSSPPPPILSLSTIPSLIPSLIHVIKSRENQTGRVLILLLGTVVMVVGGIISRSLRSRCRVKEVKRLREPSLKKAWSG